MGTTYNSNHIQTYPREVVGWGSVRAHRVQLHMVFKNNLHGGYGGKKNATIITNNALLICGLKRLDFNLQILF